MGLSCDPLISVAVVSYNHRPYIEQALDSVLSQTMEGRLEVVVGDDGSTDGTSEVVQEYARRHPDVVRPLLSRSNLGPQANGRRTLTACRGSFIAYLDGDDYWTSNRKLLDEFAYLRANPDCALCFHPVTFVDAVGKPTGQVYSATLPDKMSLQEFLGHFWTPIHLNSVLFRSSCFTMPEWVDGLEMADWPLIALALKHGSAGRLSDPMSAYRVHEGGIWSSRDNARRTDGHLRAVRVMRRRMGSALRREFDKIEYFHLWRALEYAQERNAHRSAFGLARDLLLLASDGVERFRWVKTLVREGALVIRDRVKPRTRAGQLR